MNKENSELGFQLCIQHRILKTTNKRCERLYTLEQYIKNIYVSRSPIQRYNLRVPRHNWVD